MGEAAKRRATYQDVLDAPEHVVAELVRGTLVTMPRPAPRHAYSASVLGGELHGPFSRGRGGGPGGWLILDEPELHFGDDILVPDLAGWRRERMPGLPATAYFELAPDWVCEVLSPSTEAFDRTDKVPIYEARGVPHVWLVNPLLETVEVLKLDGSSYRRGPTAKGDARARLEPFDAIELEVGALWGR